MKELRKSNYRRVLNPIARTTHHPARDSQIEKQPPAMLPATAIQPIEGKTPVATSKAVPRPPATAKIPTLKRAAFPAALMLQVSAMVTNHIL